LGSGFSLTSVLGSQPGPATHLLVGLLAVALAGCGLLAVGYDHEPLATVDEQVAEWVAENMPAPVEWLARPFTWIGSWVGLLVTGIALAAYLATGGRRWDAFWAGLTIAGVHFAVTPLLKDAFDRPRPTAGSAIDLPSSPAFPSGHAASAAATCGLLAVLAADRWPELARRIWIVAAALAFTIGASRIVLGVHWVSDVAAGWCFGVAWLAAMLLLRTRMSSAVVSRMRGSGYAERS
jgi:undecaprenyl-diphosphatase